MTVADEALVLWREQIGRRLLALDFKPLDDSPFRASIKPILMHGGLRIVRWKHSPGLTFRDEQLVKDGTTDLALILPSVGSLNFTHRNREGRLAAGDAAMLCTSQPGTLGSPLPANYIAVMLPECGLPLSGKDRDRLFGRNWSRSSNTLRLLKAYVALLERSFVDLSGDAGTAAVRHVRDLLELAAKEGSGNELEAQPDSVRVVRLRVALELIALHFRDPELSVTSVAAWLKISPRYLHRLLEEAKIRFTDHVNGLRLDEAHRALCDVVQATRSVTDIALSSGFSDVSHFNRQFRRRFDATPSAVRAGQARPYRFNPR